ncbi:autotransporter domain-containing protein, partial [Polynucleobacter sp. Ross1-W9]|uniref:autotransporter family protein n=1 Tax=Polynucleobacter parvulilacunae TaxID=1855631 RepID=UPI001C0CD796
GAVASGSTVSNGANLNVSSGGTATNSIVSSGGVQVVSSGGSSFYTQIKSGGLEVISAGGYGPYAVISAGGTQYISSGGLDSGSTILSGGTQIVGFGGTQSGALIKGTQTIIGGGVGVDGVVSGGSVTAASGSFLKGYSIIGSGGSIVASGNISPSPTVELALQVAGTSNAISLDGAKVSGNIQYGGSSNTLTLQNGVSFDGPISLVDTSRLNALTISNQKLLLANSGTATSGASFVSGWRFFNIANTASVGLADPSVILDVATLNNAGVIQLNAGHQLTLNGSYIQTGALGIGVNGPSSYGHMLVNGNANVAGGRVIVTSGVLAQNVNYSNVFRATGVTTGAFVSSGSYGLVRYSILSNGSGFDLITGSSSPAAVGLTPVLNGGQAVAIMNQAQASLQVVRDRMDEGEYRGVDTQGKNWVAPFGNIANQAGGNQTPSAAYNANTMGLAFGADAFVGEGLHAGIAGIVQNTIYKGQDIATNNNLNVASYGVVGYVKQRVWDRGEVSAMVGTSVDQSKESRLAATNGINQIASAAYGGWHGVASLEVNSSSVIGNNTFTPLTRVDYGNVNVDGYKESGANASNLNVNAQNNQSLTASIGGRYRYDLSDGQWFYARALTGYDFVAKSPQLNATDVNNIPFTTFGKAPGKNINQVGFGYQVDPKTGLGVRLSVDYFGRSGYSNSILNLNIFKLF